MQNSLALGRLLRCDQEVAQNIKHSGELFDFCVPPHQIVNTEERSELVFSHGDLVSTIFQNELVVGLVEAVLLQELPN